MQDNFKQEEENQDTGFDEFSHEEPEEEGYEDPGFGNRNSDLNDSSYNGLSHLTRSQKAALGILAFFTVLIMGLWSMNFSRNFNQPIAPAGDGNQDQDASCQGPSCPQYQEELKSMDTDGDGLSDWDELNVYKTSPYIEDSDSDGISDKEEIDQETDPNCPVGQNCSSSVAEPDPAPGAEPNPGQDGNINLDQNQLSDNELEGLLGGDLDARTLRMLLVEAGMESEVLNQISDEELLSAYQDILTQQ